MILPLDRKRAIIMNMRSHYRFPLVAGALLASLMLTGCTDTSDPSASPSAPVSQSGSATATDDGTASPSPAISPSSKTKNFRLNTEAFTVPAGSDVDSSKAAAALATAQEFATVGARTEFINGAWLDVKQKKVASWYKSVTTSDLRSVIAKLDRDNPLEANTLSSLAFVFTPTKSVTTTAACQQAASDAWQDCVAADITFSTPEVSQVEGGRIKVDFEVKTTRELVYKGKRAVSDISIKEALWMKQDDDGQWKVDAFHNTFTYGQVKNVGA